MKKLLTALLILVLLPACALAMTSSEFSRYLVYNYDADIATASCFGKIPKDLKLTESDEFIWRLGYAQALEDQQEKEPEASKAPDEDDHDPLIGVWYIDIDYPYPSYLDEKPFHSVFFLYFLPTGEIISSDIYTYYKEPYLKSEFKVFGTWSKTGVFSYDIKDESGILEKLYILNEKDLYVLSSPSEYMVYHKMINVDLENDLVFDED